jgi:hypothetical protein
VHRPVSDRSLLYLARSYLRSHAGQSPTQSASKAPSNLRSAKFTRAPEVPYHTLLNLAIHFSSFRWTHRLRSDVSARSHQSVHVQHCGDKLLAEQMAESGYAVAQANPTLFEGTESDE